MGTVRFVESKPVDWMHIQDRLAASVAENQWTNFGPVSHAFERTVEQLLELPDDHAVVATCSGTAALFALLGVSSAHTKRTERWLASAFGFASTRIGPLAGSVQLIDCGDDGLIDLEKVADVHLDQWDGLLFTNVFGRCTDLEAVTGFCERHGKALIVDNAQALFGPNRSSKRLPSEIISFHHTKPWGFGEGGCAILPREDVDLCRRLLNFGYGLTVDVAPYAANGKISDLAAAFIISRLESFAALAPRYREQWQRLANIAERAGYRVFSRLPPEGVLGFVPLQAPKPISSATLHQCQVPFAKYYPPLADLPKARQLYEHMVCIAAHPGMVEFDDADIYKELRALAGGN